MNRVVVIFYAVLSIVVTAEELDIPKNLRVCNRRSENYNECLKDAIQDGISAFVKGIPELGFPMFDPYLIESEEAEYSNALIHGKLFMKNTNTYGAAKARVLNVKATQSRDRQRLEIDVAFPKIFIEGEYEAEGGLNDFKVGGKGYYNVSMQGIRTVCDITGRIENDRWVVEHFKMLPEVEKMKVYFDDLFNGSEITNIIARNFVNEYWPLFYKEMLPIAAKNWDKHKTDLMNVVFSKLSYSKLFP